jgi:hypothetical protein
VGHGEEWRAEWRRASAARSSWATRPQHPRGAFDLTFDQWEGNSEILRAGCAEKGFLGSPGVLGKVGQTYTIDARLGDYMIVLHGTSADANPSDEDALLVYDREPTWKCN